jgi:hypothetical protein
LDIESALKLAGDNRQEMETVLKHYSSNSADSLKLRAAEFLISIMPAHFYRAEKTELYEAIDSMNRAFRHDYLDDSNIYRQQFDLYRQNYDSLEKSVQVSPTTIQNDVTSLKADFLINHIDAVFAIFEHSPWKPYLSFQNFCEYLLPYNISREKRELWYEVYKKRSAMLFANAFEQYRTQKITLCEVFNLVRDSIKIRDEIILSSAFNWPNEVPPTFLGNFLWET